MAFGGIFMGFVSGILMAFIGYVSLGFSFWLCLATYSVVGSLTALSFTVVAVALRNAVSAPLRNTRKSIPS